MARICNLLSVALLLLTGGAFAAEENGQEKQARAYVRSLTDDALVLIQDGSIGNAEKEDRLVKMFRAHVDTEWMGSFVLGRYLRSMTPDQQSRYKKLYTEYLTRSYVPNFRKYTGEKIDILRVTAQQNNEFTVQTVINGNGKKADIRVDYRLHQSGEKFLVRDIIGEGVSLITTQRSDFGGLISQKGVDYFLARLEEKVKAMLSSAASAN